MKKYIDQSSEKFVSNPPQKNYETVCYARDTNFKNAPFFSETNITQQNLAQF